MSELESKAEQSGPCDESSPLSFGMILLQRGDREEQLSTAAKRARSEMTLPSAGFAGTGDMYTRRVKGNAAYSIYSAAERGCRRERRGEAASWGRARARHGNARPPDLSSRSLFGSLVADPPPVSSQAESH